MLQFGEFSSFHYHYPGEAKSPMTSDGLWTIQFSSSEEDHGGITLEEQINRGGILVFNQGRVYGGGISYYFVGTYTLQSSGITITINATRYNDIVTSALGNMDDVRFIFNGVIDGNIMKLHGHIEDQPNKKMFITAEKRTELK